MRIDFTPSEIALLRRTQGSMTVPRFHTIEESAAIFRVSRRVFQDYIRKHPFFRTLGRRKLFTDADLNQLAAALIECPSSSQSATARQTGISVAPSEASLSTRLAAHLTKPQRKRSGRAVSGKSSKGAGATATFLSAAVAYLDGGGETRFIKPLTDHFGSKPLASIDQSAIDDAARKLYPGLKPASLVRLVYAPVSAIMKAGGDLRRIKRPKLPKGRVRWILPAEAERLIEASADHLRPLLIFMFYTGARVGEALWLEWRNVDLRRAQVQFIDTKNGRDRGVPLHPRVVAALANLPRRNTPEVFRRPDGLPYERPKADNLNDTSAGTRIKTAFKAACRRADLANFRPHDCRHTWATWFYAATRDLLALKELGGWQSLKMVERYAHVNVEHLAPHIAALPAAPVKRHAGKRQTNSRPRRARS